MKAAGLPGHSKMGNELVKQEDAFLVKVHLILAANTRLSLRLF